MPIISSFKSQQQKSHFCSRKKKISKGHITKSWLVYLFKYENIGRRDLEQSLLNHVWFLLLFFFLMRKGSKNFFGRLKRQLSFFSTLFPKKSPTILNTLRVLILWVSLSCFFWMRKVNVYSGPRVTNGYLIIRVSEVFGSK